MKNSIDIIRKFAEKQFPLSKELEKEVLYNQIQQAKQNECLSDLTALISEGYYPKEFVRWMFQGCPFIIGENGAGNIIAFSVRDGKQFTFDELFNYWKENER
jgi:hypothetical protein